MHLAYVCPAKPFGTYLRIKKDYSPETKEAPDAVYISISFSSDIQTALCILVPDQIAVPAHHSTLKKLNTRIRIGMNPTSDTNCCCIIMLPLLQHRIADRIRTCQLVSHSVSFMQCLYSRNYHRLLEMVGRQIDTLVHKQVVGNRIGVKWIPGTQIYYR